MSKKTTVFLVVFLVVFGTRLEAAPMANEGFDYASGSLNGQNDPVDGFRWAWATSSYQVEAGSLDMANMPFATRGGKMIGSGGARRTFGFQGLGLDKANLIDLSTDDTVYMGVMLAREPGNWVELRLMDGAYSTDLVKFGLGSNDKFTARMNGVSAYGGTVATSNTYFLVLKIVARASGNDEIFLKGYSETDIIGGEPDYWTAVNSADMSGVIEKLDFTATSSAEAQIDELRIGSTWADVVPVEINLSPFMHPSFRHVFKTTYQYRIYDDNGPYSSSPKCLAVDGSVGYADGSPVKLMDEEDRTVLEQHWYAYPLSNGTFHLRTIDDSFYMRVDGGADGLNDGDPVELHSVADGEDREWTSVPLADGKVAFHMGDTGLCMSSTSFANNTPLEVGTWQNNSQQRWTLKNQEPLLSPFILEDSNGELLVFFRDVLRSRADSSGGFLYASADGGETWVERTAFEENIYEPTLFILDGALYMIYADYKTLKLKKSVDHGASWSTHVLKNYPYVVETGGGGDVLVLDGVLYWGFCEQGGSGSWPEMFRLRAASCPVGADLTNSGNWIITDPLSFPSSPAIPGTRNGWLEPICVEGPDGQVWFVARVDKTPTGDAAAILKISEDRTQLMFTNQYPAPGNETGFIHAPWAGSSTFHIVHDDVSDRYLVMSNPYLGAPSSSIRSPAARNILALYETTDLKNYQLVKTLVDDDSYEDWSQSVWRTGFQSPGFVIDGSSLKYVCRTAYKGFSDYHDGNMITYHELENFREHLSPDGEMAWYRFDAPEDTGRDSSKMGGSFADVSGAAYTPSARYGGGLSFDGTDDSLALMHRVSPKLNRSNIITVSTWFKNDTQPAGRIFSSAIDALYAGLEVSVASTEIKIAGRSEPGDAYQSRSFAYSSSGEWHHLVAQWDFENDTMRLWLDKIEQTGTGSVSFGSPYYQRGAPARQDRIGCTFYDSDYFDGCMDEFHIYGRALDAGEIAALYNGPGYGEWSTRYSLAGDASDDDDSDGLANLCEYGLGGDPTNPANQGIAPEYDIAEEGGTNWFGYVHPVLSDPNHGLLYHLELTDDLTGTPWIHSGDVIITGTNVTSGALNYVSNRVSMADVARRFIRLVIEQR